MMERSSRSDNVGNILDAQIADQTRDLEMSRDDAIRANEEKLRLIHQMNSRIEEERKYLANEIHDHFNASIILARLSAAHIATLAEKDGTHPHADEIRKNAQAIRDVLSEAYDALRRLVKGLRPEILDVLGLGTAIEEMVRQYDRLHPTCRFTLEAEGNFSDLPAEIAITAYRIVQEALSNIIKHAGASVATVTLYCPAEDESLLKVCVRDDGKGFDTAIAASGIGLISIRERVAGVRGRVNIETAPGKGSAVSVDLPFLRNKIK